MVKNAWVRSPVGEDMLEPALSRKLYIILLCSVDGNRLYPPALILTTNLPWTGTMLISILTRGTVLSVANIDEKEPVSLSPELDENDPRQEVQIHRTNSAIMQATLRRRPCCPAQTGEWRGARDRTFRAGHRPWTGGLTGYPPELAWQAVDSPSRRSRSRQNC